LRQALLYGIDLTRRIRERSDMTATATITAALTALGLLALVPQTAHAAEARMNVSTAAGQEFSSQERERPRIRVQRQQPAAYDYPLPGPYAQPGPGYVRACQDWYDTEYRPSGTVVTPQMRCRWVRAR
jgi:hypothetical protein